MDDKPLMPAKSKDVEQITRRLEAGENLDDIIKVRKIKEEKQEEKKESSLDGNIESFIKQTRIDSVKNLMLTKLIFLAPASILGFLSYINFNDNVDNDILAYFWAGASIAFGAYAVYGANSEYQKLKKIK